MRHFILAITSLLLTSSSLASIGESPRDLPKEYIDAAQTLVEALRNRSAETLAELLETDVIVDRSIEGMELTRKNARDFRAGFNSARSEISKSIVRLIPEGSLVRMLRSRAHADGAEILVRMDLGELGFSYRNYIVSKGKGKRVQIVDWYDYSTGQFYTDTIRQSLAASLPGDSAYARVFESFSGKGKAKQQFVQMLTAFSKQDFTTFFSVFKDLDEASRQDRLTLVLAFGMANVSGDSQLYAQVLSMLDKHHGNDLDLQFILFDHYFNEEDYDQAIAALVGSANHMGIRDAVNFALAAVVYNQSGQTKKAIEAAEKGLALEPDVELVYWALLKGYSDEKRYAEAVGAAKQLVNEFDYIIDAESLSQEPQFSGLIASDAFKQWEASR